MSLGTSSAEDWLHPWSRPLFGGSFSYCIILDFTEQITSEFIRSLRLMRCIFLYIFRNPGALWAGLWRSRDLPLPRPSWLQGEAHGMGLLSLGSSSHNREPMLSDLVFGSGKLSQPSLRRSSQLRDLILGETVSSVLLHTSAFCRAICQPFLKAMALCESRGTSRCCL